MTKTSAAIIASVTLLIIATVTAMILFYEHNQQQPTAQAQPRQSALQSSTSSAVITSVTPPKTANAETTAYTNTRYGFTILYPSTLKPNDSTPYSMAYFMATSTDGTEGYLLIGQDYDPSDPTDLSLNGCLVPTPTEEGSPSNPATTTINGVPFLSYNRAFSDIGGNTRIYRYYKTIYQDQCFSMAEELSARAGPDSTYNDMTEIFAKFLPIIQSLRLVHSSADGTSLLASPTSGAHPLTAHFSATAPSSSNTKNSEGLYWLDFGDGYSSVARSQCGQNRCDIAGDHVFEISGTYTPHLYFKYQPDCSSQADSCLMEVTFWRREVPIVVQ